MQNDEQVPQTEETPTASGAADPSEAARHEAYKRQHDEHAWAMMAHLAVFAAGIVPFGHIFGPLTVWLIKRDVYPLVDDQGKESLNFQISMSIYTVILVVIIIVSALSLAAGDPERGALIPLIAGVAGLLLIALFSFILIIVASVKSYRGERYRYPLTIRFIS